MTRMQIDNATLADYRRCQAVTREYAKSFYFASRVLPESKRMAAYAVYEFCRRADNSVDVSAPSADRAEGLRRIELLRNRLHAVYTFTGPEESDLLALRDTVSRYEIPLTYFLDLLRGIEMDCTRDRYPNFDELHEYCYCVASVVGLMMTRVFGVSDDEGLAHAADLGTAMQLTNILRDIREDFGMGRIYLPQDEMARFGLAEEDLARGTVTQAFREAMRFQIARARQYYDSASRGIPLLTNDGSRFCVQLMSDIYSGILVAIERNDYDIFSARASVPLSAKLRIAARALMPLAPRAPLRPAAAPVTGRVREGGKSEQIHPHRSS